MALMDDFKRLPLWGQLGVFVLADVLLAALFYFFYYQGTVEQIEARRRELSQLRAKIEEGEFAQRKFQLLQAEIERYTNRIEQLKKILPSVLEIQAVFSEVSNRAKEAGLQMTSFKPQTSEDRPSQPYQVHPLNIVVMGDYHSFGRFAERIAAMDRLVNIGDFKIEVKDVNRRPPLLQVDMRVETYTYVEPPPETPRPTGVRTPARR